MLILTKNPTSPKVFKYLTLSSQNPISLNVYVKLKTMINLF